MATRLAPPQWLIPRPALEQRLDAALTHRLTTVTAPSGAGKTTALTRWAELTRGRVISIRPEHRDLDRLVSAVLDAVRDRVPSVPDVGELVGDTSVGPSSTADGMDRPTAIATRVTESLALGLRRHLALVLDDLDVLADAPDALAFVDALVRTAPSRLHVLVAGVAPAPCSLDGTAGRDTVLRLTGTDLVADHDEVAVWLEDRLGPDARGLAARVHRATGGWPALVHARIDRIGAQESSGWAAVVADPSDDLQGLVAEQIAGLPVDVGQLLRRGQHLPLLREDIAVALGSPADAVTALAGRALLADSDDRGVRLSRAVRDLLVARQPLPEEERRSAAVSAIGCFRRTGDVDLVLASARHAGDAELLASVLVEEGEGLHAHAEQVVDAHGALPPSVAARPRLQALLGVAHHSRGHWDEADRILRQLVGTEAWDAAAALRVGFIAHYRGDLLDALRWLDAGITLGRPARDVALCSALAASAEWLRGDRDRCAVRVEEALARAVALNEDAALASAHTVVAMLAAMDGDRRANLAHYDRALHHAQRAGDALQQVRILTNRGSYHLEQGAWDEALADLDAGERLAETSGFDWFLPMTLSNRAHVLLHLGRLEESAADARRSIDLWDRLGSRLLTYPMPNLARGHALRGDRDTAIGLLRRVLEETERQGETQASVPAAAELAALLVEDDAAEADRVLRWATTRRTPMNTAVVELAAARIAAHRGDAAMASTRLDAAAAAAASQQDRPALAESLTLRARLTADPLVAEEAIRAWEVLRNPVGVARATLELARLTDAPTSTRLRDRAAETLHAVGCRSFDDDLAGIGGSAPAPAAVSVQTLGRFTVKLGGQPLDRSSWQSRKARDLLKILLAHRGRPVPRDRLVGWLWDEDTRATPEALRRRLSVQLSTLRSVLDPGRQHPVDHHVVSADGAVRLDLDHVEVDVERFLALTGRAGQLQAEGRAREALDAWQQADVAFTGEFLPEDATAGWAESTRSLTRHAAMDTTMRLAEVAAEGGRHDDAVRYLLRVLEHDPYDERAHLALVGQLSAARRHGDARRRYVQYVRRMGELGIQPAPFPAD